MCACVNICLLLGTIINVLVKPRGATFSEGFGSYLCGCWSLAKSAVVGGQTWVWETQRENMLCSCSSALPINWFILGPFTEIYSVDFSNCKTRFTLSISDVKANCAEIKVSKKHGFTKFSSAGSLDDAADCTDEQDVQFGCCRAEFADQLHFLFVAWLQRPKTRSLHAEGSVTISQSLAVQHRWRQACKIVSLFRTGLSKNNQIMNQWISSVSVSYWLWGPFLLDTHKTPEN